MDLRIDSTDPVLYLCDTEVEETREDSDVKVHKDECKIINDEESGAVKVLALFISFSRCSSKRGRTGEHYCRYCRHNKRYSQFYKQKILKVLPNESAQIAAESSLLIMDIVVQFEDGSIANVEVQKIGYLFPGQRSACYSSDLLLRQYKRVRAELGQGFTYRKIQKVYTIVLFEKSNSDFSKFSKEIYIHHFEQKSDTGVEMNLLQEYTFICLDIFGDIIQNEDRKIENRLEEWLVFLSQDDPDMIIKLLNQNADFQEIYEEVYTICLNMERMMEMFSKELAILDRNTVKLMIDEMEEEVVEAKRKADEAVRKADEAESRAKQAEHREKQAREEVDNLKKELEKMKNI